MHRNWKELESDEIYAIWKEYLRTEGLDGYDPLNRDVVKSKPMRLTPMAIIKLVEELLDRLEAKEAYDGKEMDSEDAHEERCSSRGNGCSERKENPCKEARCCC